MKIKGGVNKSQGHRTVQGLLGCPTQFLAGIGLVFSQEVRSQFDITRFVHPMYVSEACGDTEILSDFAEGVIHIPDILRLRVQAGVVYARIIHTVLLASRDSDFHLKPKTKRDHALEVFDACSDVFLLGLFGQVKHVGGEQRDLMLFVVRLISLEHALEPLEKFVGTMVAVQNDRSSGR